MLSPTGLIHKTGNESEQFPTIIATVCSTRQYLWNLAGRRDIDLGNCNNRRLTQSEEEKRISHEEEPVDAKQPMGFHHLSELFDKYLRLLCATSSCHVSLAVCLRKNLCSGNTALIVTASRLVPDFGHCPK